MLRAELIKAQENLKKAEKGGPQRTFAVAFMQIVKREVPLLVTADKAQDIMSALRLAKEFNLRIVLTASARPSL